MSHGGKRPGAGKPKGAKNKLLTECAHEVKFRGITPAEFLDAKMHDSDDEGVQVEAAKALMPYVHKKQPEARELTHKQDAANPALAVAAMRALMGL